MAVTKIQIKVSREEYELLLKVAEYAVASVTVTDLFSLYEMETLETFRDNLKSKRFRDQKSYAFSFDPAQLYVFINRIGGIMNGMGLYEKAVFNLIYENQIVHSINNAVQTRLKFK